MITITYQMLTLDTGSLARSGDINDRYENVISGFDRLPNPAVVLRFNDRWRRVNHELEHLVTRNCLKTSG